MNNELGAMHSEEGRTVALSLIFNFITSQSASRSSDLALSISKPLYGFISSPILAT